MFPLFRMICFSLIANLVVTFNVTSAATQAKTTEQIDRTTKAFQLRIHTNSNAIADQAAAVAEETWSVAADLYGANLPKNERLQATLYRDALGYEAIEQKLTKGAFKRNLAFAHFDSLSAHVAIQPDMTDDGLSDVGLPKLTVRMLAHEMAHLVRFHHMPHSFRNHPGWLLDGMASHIDKRVVQELGFVDNPMDDPDSGMKVFGAKQLLESNKLPSAAALLSDAKIELEFYQRYSVRWVFVDMLMTKHEQGFREFLKELRRLGGGQGFVERSSKLLIDKLGVDTDKLDADFREHIESLSPGWVEHYRLLETGGETWHQIAFPKSNSEAWLQTPLPRSVSISVEATFLSGTNNQLNLRLGGPTKFTQYSITAGFGLNVFRFENSEWTTVEKKEIAGLKPGQGMKLEILQDADSHSVEMKLGGEVIYSGKLRLEKSDRLCLSAQHGSIVAWKNLQVQGKQ